MNRLYTTLSAIMMAAVIALPSRAATKVPSSPATQDTLIMKLKNNAKVLVVVKDLKDIKSLRTQSLDSMMLLLDKYTDRINAAGARAQASGGTVSLTVTPSKDMNDPNAPEEVDITVIQNGDGNRNIITRELKKRVRIDVDVDDSENRTTVGVNVNADSTSNSDKDENRKKHRNSDKEFDFQINTGLNTLLNVGDNGPDLKAGSSRYISLNSKWIRQIGGEESPLQLYTGFGFDFHNYMFDNGDILMSSEESVYFTKNPDISIQKSKLTTTTFNIPLELGLDFKGKDGHTDFKIGGGGFVGYMLNNHTKLKYSEDGDTKKSKGKDNYHLNDFQYGVSGFIGVRSLELFAKYNLNELFEENKGPQAQALAFGLRLKI